ncbi:MAG: FecR domain-containing protein [Acidobacteria bacterium]|nr:FecR domain-containing protein [Acidobacteriota bacterium]
MRFTKVIISVTLLFLISHSMSSAQDCRGVWTKECAPGGSGTSIDPEAREEMRAYRAYKKNFDAGLKLYHKSQPMAALPYFQEALRYRPNDQAARWYVGHCPEVARAIELSGLAEQAWNAGNYDLAIQYEMQVLALDPGIDNGRLADFQGKRAAALDAAKRNPPVGRAASVKGDVYWLTSAGRKVKIKDNDPIIFNARIETGNGARLQVILLDETMFTVGPGSDMVIDEFVYDPATSAGKVSARIAKGTFRFISGKVVRKDPDSMKIKLHCGELGIRGTDVEVSVEKDGSGSIRLYSGEVDLTKNNGERVYLNAGEMVAFSSDGSVGTPTTMSDMNRRRNDLNERYASGARFK